MAHNKIDPDPVREIVEGERGSYRIEATDNLSNPWEAIETNIIGEGGVVGRLYSVQGQPNRFFRAMRD